MHELKLDNGLSVFFNTAEELDKFKAREATMKNDSMTAQELRDTLEATQASLAEKTAELERIQSEEPEDNQQALIDELTKQLEAEFVEKAELLAEAMAETGEKADSLVKKSKREILEMLTGVKNDSYSDAEMSGIYKGMKLARKSNIKDTKGHQKRKSAIHEKLGVSY